MRHKHFEELESFQKESNEDKQILQECIEGLESELYDLKRQNQSYAVNVKYLHDLIQTDSEQNIEKDQFMNKLALENQTLNQSVKDIQRQCKEIISEQHFKYQEKANIFE